MGLFNKSGGWQCEDLPDGTKTCRRYINKDNERHATGSQVNITADPEQGCEPIISGGMNTLNDDDMEELGVPLTIAKKQCLHGRRQQQ